MSSSSSSGLLPTLSASLTAACVTPCSSSDPSSSSSPQLIVCSPDHFKIDLPLHTDVHLELLLSNPSPSHILAFKVKTTNRDRYLLRPTAEYIAPSSSKVCKIIMHKIKSYAELGDAKGLKDKLTKDKFLVQATLMEREVEDMTAMWKELESHHNPKLHQFLYSETKIKCRLNVPVAFRAAESAKRGEDEEAAAIGSVKKEDAVEDKSNDDVKKPAPKASTNELHPPSPASSISLLTPPSSTTHDAFSSPQRSSRDTSPLPSSASSRAGVTPFATPDQQHAPRAPLSAMAMESLPPPTFGKRADNLAVKPSTSASTSPSIAPAHPVAMPIVATLAPIVPVHHHVPVSAVLAPSPTPTSAPAAAPSSSTSAHAHASSAASSSAAAAASVLASAAAADADRRQKELLSMLVSATSDLESERLARGRSDALLSACKRRVDELEREVDAAKGKIGESSKSNDKLSSANRELERAQSRLVAEHETALAAAVRAGESEAAGLRQRKSLDVDHTTSDNTASLSSSSSSSPSPSSTPKSASQAVTAYANAPHTLSTVQIIMMCILIFVIGRIMA